MARLQDFNTVTPSGSDNLLIVQSQGQGLATLDTVLGGKMDKANPAGTGSLSMNRKANTTTGLYSVTEGENGEASGRSSHAEGANNVASGAYSHAEGYQTTSSGGMAHAENRGTTASGDYSHSEGYGTIANHKSQHVFGEYNETDPSTAAATARGNYIEVVGKGTSASARSNARTLDWSGNEVLAGDLTINGTTSLGTLVSNLANVKVGISTIAGGATMKVTGSSGLCCATFNNSNTTCSIFSFSLMANTFRFKPADSTDTRLSATRDSDTGEITITNGSGSYATIIVFYW